MLDAALRKLIGILPPELTRLLEALPPEVQASLEELRFRRGIEVTAVVRGREQPLSLKSPAICTVQTIACLINAATGYSAYAADDTLCMGFLPLPGGHRLGICGTAVLDGRRIRTFKDFSSASLRIARHRPGCAAPLLEILRENETSTLVIGPPGSGKTTLLRDAARQLSDVLGRRVGLVDSRGEIAACEGGSPQFPVGKQTDILHLTPKEAGLEILVRVMNPDWVALDEITAAEDVEAMVRASYCGVRLLATAHAFGREDLWQRPLYRTLLDTGVFRQLAILDREKQVHTERM